MSKVKLLTGQLTRHMMANMTTYRISFTQRTTVSTSFGPTVEPGSSRYYLKANDGKSAQHVGYAIIQPDRKIRVTTCSGVVVGVAANRREASHMLDAYHRQNNHTFYWMWMNKALKVAA